MKAINGIAVHPAFADVGNAIPLSGYSGAVIGLVKTPGGTRIVRKAAALHTDNAALRLQSERQRRLRVEVQGAARVPEVLSEGEVGGLYFFDMEYVPSRDATSLLSRASFPEIADFSGSLERFFEGISSRTMAGQKISPCAEIDRKLCEIDRRCNGFHSALLDPLRQAVAHPHLLSELLPTPAHGDLTFENLLVSAQSEFWLIDPIPSPFDHYWFDWAKLFQDAEGLWHRHRGRPLSAGVTHWLRDRWLTFATKLDERYALWHYVLLGLTFARILPYAKSPDDIVFVTSRVRAFGQAAIARLESGK